MFSMCADLLFFGFQSVPSRQLSKPRCLWTFDFCRAPEIPEQGCLDLFLRPSFASGLDCLGSSTASGSGSSRTLGLLNRLWRESNTKVHSTYMVVLTNMIRSGSANKVESQTEMKFPLRVISAAPISGWEWAQNTIFWLKLQLRYQLLRLWVGLKTRC